MFFSTSLNKNFIAYIDNRTVQPGLIFKGSFKTKVIIQTVKLAVCCLNVFKTNGD